MNYLDYIIESVVEKPKFDNNFWNWFKGSKVVDDEGNPLIVYHGSTLTFNEFKAKTNPTQLGADFGFWFTDDIDVATSFSKVLNDDSSRKYYNVINSDEHTKNLVELKKQAKITTNDILLLYSDLLKISLDKLKDNLSKHFNVKKDAEILNYLENNKFSRNADGNEISSWEYDEIKRIQKQRYQNYMSMQIQLENEILKKASENQDKGKVYKCYLLMKNPLIVDGEDIGVTWERYNTLLSAMNAGHDGVIIKNGDTGQGFANEYVVFKANQIKSIDAKKFNPKSNNIYEKLDYPRSKDDIQNDFVIKGQINRLCKKIREYNRNHATHSTWITQQNEISKLKSQIDDLKSQLNVPLQENNVSNEFFEKFIIY